MAALRTQGIGCAPYFPAIHLQPLYRDRFGFDPNTFPVCEATSHRTLALPFHPGLDARHIGRVAETIEAALPRLPRAT
jgi:perosamine synthetase